ncbi:hypothetical protein Hanom_Chr14g01312281 [Helianthus anomalus]
MNRIGERCGRLVKRSEASVYDSNISEDKMAIVIQSGKRFSSEVLLTCKEHVIRAWVEECEDNWSPEFLNFLPESEAPATPPIKSQVVKVNGREEEDERVDNVGNCMGGVHGEQGSHVSDNPQGSRCNDVLEAGDPTPNSSPRYPQNFNGPFNSPNEAHYDHLGSGLAYVTVRPKDKLKKRRKVVQLTAHYSERPI